VEVQKYNLCAKIKVTGIYFPEKGKNDATIKFSFLFCRYFECNIKGEIKEHLCPDGYVVFSLTLCTLLKNKTKKVCQHIYDYLHKMFG
jgi:hypothetical protein